MLKTFVYSLGEFAMTYYRVKRPFILGTLSLFLLWNINTAARAFTVDELPLPYSVKDVYPLDDLTNVNGILFFASGEQLWRSDGSDAGTYPIAGGASLNGWQPSTLSGSQSGRFPLELTNFNGTLFYTAVDETGQRGLWQSAGTPASSYLIKNFDGSLESTIYGLTQFNDELFFNAFTAQTGAELWRSDGTPEGTVLVKDIQAGNSDPQNLMVVGNTLFFTAYAGSVPYRQLWKSDGTEAGTVLVQSANTSMINPAFLTNVNDTLFFTANSSAEGRELWKSDGTEAGTVLVKAFKTHEDSNLTELTAAEDTLFFVHSNSQDGKELWQSDGSAAGTTFVKQISPPEIPNAYVSLASIKEYLFFEVADKQGRVELWISDGTVEGIQLVKGFDAPGSIGDGLGVLKEVNGLLFFSAPSDDYGHELWRSDGTLEGTVMLGDLNPGLDGSYPNQFTLTDNLLFFAAESTADHVELWAFDAALAKFSPESVMVAEGRESVSYEVVLNYQPSSDVTVAIEPNEDVLVSTPALQFSRDNWSQPQTVTITAVNDTQIEGLQVYHLTHLLNGAAPTHKDLVAGSITVIVEDDEATNTIFLPIILH